MRSIASALRGFTYVMLAVTVAILLPRSGSINSSTNLPYVVVVDSSVRSQLAHSWSATDPSQVERGMCVIYHSTSLHGQKAWRVVDAFAGITREATHSHIHFSCPTLSIVSILHTHPPYVCAPSSSLFPGHCALGRVSAHYCAPSKTDQESLDRSEWPFALIQCDRDVLVAYFRRDSPLDSVTYQLVPKE